jgi:phage baseplate assembly protein W
MLTELTQEQEELIPVIRDKWINITLHQPTRSADIVTKNVQSLYAMSGLQEPNVILCTLSEFCDYFNNTAVYSAVNSAVRSAVNSAVRPAVRSAVRPAVYSAVDSAVYSAVDSVVNSAVYSAVYSAVRSAVYSAVNSAVRSAVRPAVYSAVRSAVDSVVNSAVYWRADDIAYGDYFVNIGAISGDVSDNLQKYADILQDFGYAMYTKETAYVLVKPRLHLNDQGLPHNTRGLAIAWEDGSGIYALNGVIFPKELYEKVTSGNMPFADILAIEDIDQRTQAMRFGNVWDFIKHQNATLIDSHTKDRQDGTPVRYWLYRFPKGDIFADDVDYMIYDDLVPGSTKQYMSGVPTSNTVAEAMAWKHQTTPGHWAIMQPGIDMN